MGDTPETEQAGPAVVVVETADTGPTYVTTGELDARLQLLGDQLGERINAAVRTALEAEDRADVAAATAAEAAVVAAIAAETAETATAETASTGVDQGDDDEHGDENGGVGPKAPQPRRTRSNGERQARSPRTRYGAGWLSGR